jgi:general secretion pathway protein A
VSDTPESQESSFRTRPLLALFPPAGTATPRQSAHSVPATPARAQERAYGLDEQPFAQSADPRFRYASAEHERITEELLATVRRRDGLVVLSGADGTGKTLFSRTVSERLDRRVLTSVLLEPPKSFEELLSVILANFGVISDVARERAMEPGRREKLVAALHDFLHSLTPLDAFAVLWIDDADQFPDRLLNQLIAVVGGHVAAHQLQLVLAGGSGIDALLERIAPDSTLGGIATRLTLGPLNEDEIAPYIFHRLDVAGSSRHVSFDETVSPRVMRLTGGVPAAVNALCDRALEVGYVEGVAEIDASVIERAAESLDLPADDTRWTDMLLTVAVSVCGAITGGSIAAFLLHHRVAQLLDRL